MTICACNDPNCLRLGCARTRVLNPVDYLNPANSIYHQPKWVTEEELRLKAENERLRDDNKSLLEVMCRFVEAYAGANPIRQADCHPYGCMCLRCAYDDARDALAEHEKK